MSEPKNEELGKPYRTFEETPSLYTVVEEHFMAMHPGEEKRCTELKVRQERKEMGDDIKSILLHVADYQIEGNAPDFYIYLKGGSKGPPMHFETEDQAVDHILDIAVDLLVNKLYRYYP